MKKYNSIVLILACFVLILASSTFIGCGGSAVTPTTSTSSTTTVSTTSTSTTTTVIGFHGNIIRNTLTAGSQTIQLTVDKIKPSQTPTPPLVIQIVTLETSIDTLAYSIATTESGSYYIAIISPVSGGEPTHAGGSGITGPGTMEKMLSVMTSVEATNLSSGTTTDLTFYQMLPTTTTTTSTTTTTTSTTTTTLSGYPFTGTINRGTLTDGQKTISLYLFSILPGSGSPTITKLCTFEGGINAITYSISATDESTYYLVGAYPANNPTPECVAGKALNASEEFTKMKAKIVKTANGAQDPISFFTITGE